MAHRPPALVSGANRLMSGLQRVGIGRISLDEEVLLESARRRTGLGDFGEDGYREGLSAFLRSCDETDLTPFGRFWARSMVTHLLENRLRVAHTLAAEPGIEQAQIPQPLVVTGLPRTGTTLIYNLLALNPAARTLRLWELQRPCPPPQGQSHDPRIGQTRRMLRLFQLASPRFKVAHEFDAERPEECWLLFLHTFCTPQLYMQFGTASYRDWMHAQDMASRYAYYRKLLQILTCKTSGSPLVLKYPYHIACLSSLLATLPQARVVQTHRNPRAVLPSICSLVELAQTSTTWTVDRRRLGSNELDRWSSALRSAVEVRQTASAERFCDVHFRDLVADPLDAVRRVHAHFDMEFTPEHAARVTAYMADNPMHKHGAHRYELADYGLQEDQLDQAFAPYLDWLQNSPPPAL